MDENSLETRLRALESESFDDDEKELLRFVIKAVKSARGTIWLTNGTVKYLLPLIGVIWGLYHYGAESAIWAVARIKGLSP